MAIFFHKIDRNIETSIKIEEIKRKVEDYLISTKCNKTAPAANLYGISVWRKLASQLANFTDNNDYLDIRASRAMLEHKTIMRDRIRLLYDMNFIPNAGNEYEKAVVRPSSVIYALCLKYNLTKRKELLHRVSEIIERICLDEERILEELFLNTAI